MVLHVREVREAEEVGPEGERGGEGPVARRGVLGVLEGESEMITGKLAWGKEHESDLMKVLFPRKEAK